MRLCLVLFCSIVCNLASGESLTIAVASNFHQPVKYLVERYESLTDYELTIVSGSSAKLMAQAIHGAPFDIFLSADQEKVSYLISENVAIAESRTTYAVGTLVLLSHLPINNKNISDVLSESDKKVAIANPRLAPYGLAAKQTLESLGLYKKLKHRLVYGENINQTFQFVHSGSAKLGLVAYAQVKSQNISSDFYIEIPESLHRPIMQDGIVLKRAKSRLVARDFMQFLTSDEGRSIIQSFGYKKLEDY